MSGAGFLVDLHRCVGCGACVLACRLENGWSTDSAWRRVLPLNLRRHPGGPTYFLSVACHHCEDPACLEACPSRAYEKRPDGIVVHHEDRCLGCRYCEMACPFGAPQYNAARGVVGKCHLCHHRLDGAPPEGAAPVTGGQPPAAGSQTSAGRPACVAACPTEALQVRPPGAPGVGDNGVPGFTDVASCRPQTEFKAPRGRRRGELYGALVRRLESGP
jgi:Fe-S-cluster-containing dehydrogenase component